MTEAERERLWSLAIDITDAVETHRTKTLVVSLLASEIQRAVEEEREACALMVENYVGGFSINRLDDMLQLDERGDLLSRASTAIAIRSRGKE
jgi:hypothetical protein